MVQLQMIDKVKSVALNDKNVSAVLMYGSFTKDEGDEYSDIEFYVFLNDKEHFSSESWVNQINPVAVFFTNEYGSEVAIFENLVRGEFHFLGKSEMRIIRSWEGLVEFSEFDKMVLVDKEGLLADTLEQIEMRRPDRATPGNILWLSQSLLNVLLTTSNLIKRGEYAHAYQSLTSVHKHLLWMIRVETSRTQHWESPSKSLEKDIDPSWYSAFQQTTAELNPSAIEKAFKKSLEVSGRLFASLGVETRLRELLRALD